MRFLLVTLLYLLGCTVNGLLMAQEKPKEYNFSYLTINNGLCDNSIRAIHKDRNSFMWFGTANGLDRYDGYEVKHYSAGSVLPQQFIESNYINDISEDELQSLWVASDAGIFRIDLQQENIAFYKEYEGLNKEILSTPVQSIFVDEFQNLWIGTNDCLAYVKLNREREITKIEILKQGVSANTFTRHGNDVWVGGKNLLLRYNAAAREKYHEIPFTSNLDFSQVTINALFSFGDYLWIGSQSGLFCLNTKKDQGTHYQHNPADQHSISSNFIMDIDKNDSGDIVVATRNGVNIFQRDEHFVQYGDESGQKSLNNTIINKIFVDEDNCIWAGTDFGGVNIMVPKYIHFTHTLQTFENGIPFIISCVLEDREGNLLAGMVDGGLAIRKKDEDNFSFHRHRPNDPASLSHNHITDIVQDFKGDYWISTVGGGLDKLSAHNLHQPMFEHYTTENSGLLSNEIHDLYLDSVRNSIWICSSKHIQMYDFTTGRINRLPYYTRSKEIPDHMHTIFIDSQSRLWIGGNGVYIIDLKDYRNGYECIYYKHKLDDPLSKINEKITCIIETRDHEIYLGSMGNGIYQLDKNNSSIDTYSFINYAARSGLSDSSIASLTEDENGNIWIGTLRGIYLFNGYTKRGIKFDEKDGLQVQQFYKKSGCITADHQIILGSTNGLVSFNPLINLPKKKDRRVTLTSFQLNGQEMIPYLHQKNLSTSITQTKELHLYPPHNSFELAFSSLDYTVQDKVFYFHRIQELGEKANVGLSKRNARYTNLSAGKYTFEVWCTNYDNAWSPERTFLTIVVHPRFYQTTWFSLLVVFLCITIFFYMLYSYTQRQRNIQKLLKAKIEERTSALIHSIAELEHSQSDIIEKNEQLQLQNGEINKQKNEIYEMSLQMEKLNKEKISYFTNVAHEFKTPLTLILGPTDQLIKQTPKTEDKENLEMINRNANYLLSMVNQLIDLQKLDTKNLALDSLYFDLSQLLNQTASDFSNLMQIRQIHLATGYRLQHTHIVSDREKIHKILYNLLSNAVKYTPEKGTITLHACQFTDGAGDMMQYLSVTNSGSVIEEKEREKIFDRYYRIPDQYGITPHGQSSTGIGLHIVKELVALLNGTITVKSTPKTGVSFRFLFPISITKTVPEEAQEVQSTASKEDIISPFIPIDQDKPNLLLVEDNPDMRKYIKKMLSQKFNVAEANNGETGYEAARNILPDFIVSDLMMPVVDGAGLCRKIRDNMELCHIPFLLLTANSSESAYIESYANGTDGYITKPFEESVLMAQIDAIMKNRDLRQKKFMEAEMNLSVLEVGQSDQQFMKEVMQVIEKNYTDSNFGVKELITQLNMSYTLIYKKFVSLTGVPPVRFLLLYRLKIARMILEKNKNNNIIVSEIAYRVGFNDPKYFTRCFVKQYNMTPSSIINQEA